MESFLLSLGLPLLLLLIFLIPWLRADVTRAVPTVGVGFVKERLLLGLWVQVRGLSNRRNRLEAKVNKLSKDLKQNKKLLEDEELRLKAEIDVINSRYRNYLHDFGGKRSWHCLYRITPVPALSFIEPILESDARKKVEQNTTYFTLDHLLSELNGFYRTTDPDRIRRTWGWKVKQPPNNNNSKRKGGNQQNNQNQNSNNSNDSNN